MRKYIGREVFQMPLAPEKYMAPMAPYTCPVGQRAQRCILRASSALKEGGNAAIQCRSSSQRCRRGCHCRSHLCHGHLVGGVAIHGARKVAAPVGRDDLLWVDAALASHQAHHFVSKVGQARRGYAAAAAAAAAGRHCQSPAHSGQHALIHARRGQRVSAWRATCRAIGSQRSQGSAQAPEAACGRGYAAATGSHQVQRPKVCAIICMAAPRPRGYVGELLCSGKGEHQGIQRRRGAQQAAAGPGDGAVVVARQHAAALRVQHIHGVGSAIRRGGHPCHIGRWARVRLQVLLGHKGRGEGQGEQHAARGEGEGGGRGSDGRQAKLSGGRQTSDAHEGHWRAAVNAHSRVQGHEVPSPVLAVVPREVAREGVPYGGVGGEHQEGRGRGSKGGILCSSRSGKGSHFNEHWGWGGRET